MPSFVSEIDKRDRLEAICLESLRNYSNSFDGLRLFSFFALSAYHCDSIIVERFRFIKNCP